MGKIELFQQKVVDDFNNPFAADNITGMSTYCFRDMYGNWRYNGSVKFKNKNTEGEQKFKAGSFGSLLKKMERFVENI